MEASTTIRKMMTGNKILVPDYQRAYSWDTPLEKTDKNTQTDVFLSDLEEYSRGNANSAYYFGHFLFEDKGSGEFHVIDGQQRLTTIVIFLSALFLRLRKIRALTDYEKECYEDMIKRNANFRFLTVQYDKQVFVDYVIHQTKVDHHGLETESARRIVRAFDYFNDHLSDKSEDYLAKMLKIITDATCTTHPVKHAAEAIQMFIFQNSRGKRPSNLEVVKAQFMHYVHLHGNGENEVNALVDEIKSRFEKIYKSIASIEYRIQEDDILLYTLRVYFNSLWETNSLDRINKILAKDDSLNFVRDFTIALSASFDHLNQFFGKDEHNYFAIHSLVTLGGIAIALPFIIKGYRYGLPMSDIEQLCSALESLIVRHRVIGTKADMTSRISDVFEKFTQKNSDITPILDHIEMLKTTTNWWWAYWNNDKLRESLQGGLNHSVARFLLWKYENHLISQGKGGSILRYDQIDRPELEHIAPTTEPETKPHGYDFYDEDFKTQYLNCLGNYMLLTKIHNIAASNDPFSKKHSTYTRLEQQREVQRLAPNPNKNIWDRVLIQQRQDKIVNAIMGMF
jgi:hypothetical protein